MYAAIRRITEIKRNKTNHYENSVEQYINLFRVSTKYNFVVCGYPPSHAWMGTGIHECTLKSYLEDFS